MDGERQSSKENTTGILRLFVYGTLKRGYWNHDRFCRGVLDVQEAVVRGRLYEMPSGIPVLEVPVEDILAHGTADPIADVATCLRADTHRQAQRRYAEELASVLEPVPESTTAGDWGPVYGELLTFDLPAPKLRQAGDPETRLPAIDRLEGFQPLSASRPRQAGGRLQHIQTRLGSNTCIRICDFCMGLYELTSTAILEA